MPQVSKPAALKTGHKWSKSDLKQQIKREKFLGGSNNVITTPPKQLNNTAKKYYEYIVNNLKNSGILTNLDVFVVAETAICLSRMRKCDEILDKQGLIYYRVTKKGFKIPCEHPAVNEKNKYMQQFKMLSNQIGLSPSSRSKLATINIDQQMSKQDPLNNILKNPPKNIK